MIDVDYDTLEDDVESGALRVRLEAELIDGFRLIHAAGQRLPTASHYASQIAEIVGRGAPAPMHPDLSFNLYQEILAACEHARAVVLGEKVQ